MKLDQLRKIIREEVRSAVKEELQDVITEAVWFANRSASHTRFVFDDHNKYAMSVIANSLLYFGFKTKEMGQNKCLLEKK